MHVLITEYGLSEACCVCSFLIFNCLGLSCLTPLQCLCADIYEGVFQQACAGSAVMKEGNALSFLL